MSTLVLEENIQVRALHAAVLILPIFARWSWRVASAGALE